MPKGAEIIIIFFWILFVIYCRSLYFSFYLPKLRTHNVENDNVFIKLILKYRKLNVEWMGKFYSGKILVWWQYICEKRYKPLLISHAVMVGLGLLSINQVHICFINLLLPRYLKAVRYFILVCLFKQINSPYIVILFCLLDAFLILMFPL